MLAVATAQARDPSQPAGSVDRGSSACLDRADRRIYRYSDEGGAPQVSKLLKQANGSDLSKPSGLALDGDPLWVVDKSKKIVYRYSAASAFAGTGTVNALQQIVFSSGNSSAEGLAIDSAFVYVLDDGAKRFYRYRRTGGAATASRTLLTVNGQKLNAPAGATFDTTSLWVLDASTRKVLQYVPATLFSGNGSANAVFEFALVPENEAAQGL